MNLTPKDEFTKLLLSHKAAATGKRSNTDKIFDIVYSELHRVASGFMRRERVEHTLQPTALVHEAYCRLVDQTRIEWQNRAHFFGIAARAMRQILVNHAYRRGRAKRGGDFQRVTLDEKLGIGVAPDIDVIELNDALSKLEEIDARMTRVVEMHIFGGLPIEEVAHLLGISRRTAFKDWRVARMWLKRMFTEGVGSPTQQDSSPPSDSGSG